MRIQQRFLKTFFLSFFLLIYRRIQQRFLKGFHQVREKYPEQFHLPSEYMNFFQNLKDDFDPSMTLPFFDFYPTWLMYWKTQTGNIELKFVYFIQILNENQTQFPKELILAIYFLCLFI